MRKIITLFSSVSLLAGCFICHRPSPKEDIKGEEIVEIQSPAPKEKVVTYRNISEAANFAFDSSKISPDNNKIDELVKAINAQPDADIYIEGNTDNVGTEAYNKKLSLKRANAVAEELKKRGVSADRIHVEGVGFAKPIASNETEEGRAHNRRVDVTLISK